MQNVQNEGKPECMIYDSSSWYILCFKHWIVVNHYNYYYYYLNEMAVKLSSLSY